MRVCRRYTHKISKRRKIERGRRTKIKKQEEQNTKDIKIRWGELYTNESIKSL